MTCIHLRWMTVMQFSWKAPEKECLKWASQFLRTGDATGFYPPLSNKLPEAFCRLLALTSASLNGTEKSNPHAIAQMVTYTESTMLRNCVTLLNFSDLLPTGAVNVLSIQSCSLWILQFKEMQTNMKNMEIGGMEELRGTLGYNIRLALHSTFQWTVYLPDGRKPFGKRALWRKSTLQFQAKNMWKQILLVQIIPPPCPIFLLSYFTLAPT